eukprot:scaffold1795_cov140-Isochrysis_galbana.AAC.3
MSGSGLCALLQPVRVGFVTDALCEPGYLDAVVSARSHYRIEIREERAPFQVERTGSIGSTIGDPRLHAWAAGGAHPGDSHSEYPASIHLLEFEEEVRDVLPQCCLHLGWRALTRQGHLCTFGLINTVPSR